MLYADEEVLIDFTKLTADINIKRSATDQATDPNQNRRTIMDYGQGMSSTYTADQKALMKTSLAIVNWDVVFNSSSETIANVSNTYTRQSTSQQFGDLMGVRIHYPLDQAYSKAIVKPPFEIPAYEWGDVDESGTVQQNTSYGIKDPSRFEDGYGVLKNVGTIRSVAVQVYGLNFPHGLNVILIDSEGKEKVCFMGYLNFDGWAELTWNNPQYIFEVRNRDLRLYPLYPWTTPFIKFGGFRLDRDADQMGGDFVTYFKEVKVIFDKAVLDESRDIDDEAIWGIINQRETEKRLLEMEKFGQAQLLRFLDYQRQSRETWDPLGNNPEGTGTPYNYGFSWDEQ
jgi:hypothetical protein